MNEKEAGDDILKKERQTESVCVRDRLSETKSHFERAVSQKKFVVAHELKFMFCDCE